MSGLFATASEAHPFGAWSLVPPLLAIVLAIATRRIIPSLLAAVFAGALILSGANPFRAFYTTCESFLWPQLIDSNHMRVFVFTLAMGGMVGVISRSGGMHGLVNLIIPWAKDRRRGQATGWLLGLLVFFDDYANTLLLGNTMRPITDRLKISREKLAYVVDSTAAPVAGLALISTWIAGEVGYIDDGFKSLPVGEYNAFAVFIDTIAYRYYPLLALLFVGLVAMLGRDFGPMLAAERRASRETPADKDHPVETAERPEEAAFSPTPGQPQRWQNAVLPVLVVLVVVVWLILQTGYDKVKMKEPTFWDIFTEGDSYLALLYGSLAGFFTAVGLAVGQGLLVWREARTAAVAGARLVAPALAILWLAWCLQAVAQADQLDTAGYVGAWTKTVVSSNWLPTVVFLLSAGVAFATGTSWGTMAILTPLVIGVAFDVLGGKEAGVTANHPIMLATVGSVLAGAIFGDHCSPISDTTVLSSAASGCDHVAHVWTQMPYALTVAAVSILFGTIPAGFGLPLSGSLLCLGLGAAILAAILLLAGRTVESPEQTDAE